MRKKKKRPNENDEIVDNDKPLQEISDTEEEKRKRDRDAFINQSTLEDLKQKDRQRELEEELQKRKDIKRKSNKSRKHRGGQL